MNGNFQNNYRGGWNNMPFNDFSQEQFNYNYQHTPTPPCVDNRQLPHQAPTPPCVDNRQLAHQMPTPYVDSRQLAHQMPTSYVENRQLPQPMPTPYVDSKPLPHPAWEQYVDNRQLPHQMSTQYADNWQVPHQLPVPYVDKRQLPPQMPAQYSDNTQLSHQPSLPYVDSRQLASQPPAPQADNRQLPHQTHVPYVDIRQLLHQMQPQYSDNTQLPHQPLVPYVDRQLPPQPLAQHADNRQLPHQLLPPYADSRLLPHQIPVHYADNRYLPHPAPAHYADNKYLTHQTPAPYADNRPLAHQTLALYADNSTLPHQMPTPYADNRHVRHHTPEDCTDKMCLPQQTRESFVDKSPVPPQNPEEFADSKCHLSEQLLEDYADESQLPQKAPEDYADKKCLPQHVCKICGCRIPHKCLEQHNKGRRHQKNLSELRELLKKRKRDKRKNKCAKALGFKVANLKNEGHGSKRKIEGATTGKGMKINNGKKKPVKSSKPGVNALSNFANCLVEIPESESPPIGSEVSTSVAAVTETEMSESKVHNEIQNHVFDSNDQQQSISMELDDLAGSINDNQTGLVNSDSAAIEIFIEPLASAPPDPSLSSFEPLTEHGLHTETEPQVSEAVVCYERQHLSEEISIPLLPSGSMEIDTASEASDETETEDEDESSQSEVEMDVLETESGSTKLPKIPVCLTCGDVGFEETLVYCNKCEECALHRYCLDGPVIFTDEVIWYCEDCEEEVIDTNCTDQDSSDSSDSSDSESEVDSSEEECVADVHPQPISDPIWRGSLKVCHKSVDKVTRLMGHLSTLACRKVLEEARHIPDVLYGELLQRSAVWPESFKKFGTNNLSIGLYFFPQNERVERYFDQLVHEMISNDLAIRTFIVKAELLIFPSTVLPSEYKRFQSKYYLWGVFRRNQSPSKKSDVGSSGKDASVLPDNNLLK